MPESTIASLADPPVPPPIEIRSLWASFGNIDVVRGVTHTFTGGQVSAIVGPSGCGKSTLLRCINRLHERVPGARMNGSIRVGDTEVVDPGLDLARLRSRIGMVFQRPTPFPTMSVFDNVAAGVRLRGFLRRGSRTRLELAELVERALRRAGLWNEVRDLLAANALSLSGGQQQRLCIARALVTEPDVLLLDEPTASLDPLATQRIEELLYELRGTVTTILVTHNLQQAARLSDTAVFMLRGELVEAAPTRQLFTTPRDDRTEAYITGRFG